MSVRSRRCAFFSSYLVEANPAVARVLIEQLLTHETNESLGILKRFQGQARSVGVTVEAEQGMTALKERIQ